MDVAISVSGVPDADAELRSLFRWLQREDDVPPSSVRFAPAPPSPDTLGGWSDAIMVTLGSGGAAIVAKSISVWIQHRTSDLKITFRSKAGRTVVLDSKRIKRIKDPLEVIEALKKAAGGSDDAV